MNVENIYSEDGVEASPSRATLFLQGLITFLWWAALFFLAIYIFAFSCAALKTAGIGPDEVQFFINHILGDTEPFQALVSYLIVIIYIFVFLVVLKQLRSICQTLVIEDPFVPENARRLRRIWIAVAIGEVFRLVSGLALSFVRGESSLTGKDMVINLDFSPAVWFLVFAFIIFAELFGEGARLRQEQKLTV